MPRMPQVVTWMGNRPIGFQTLVAYLSTLLLGLLDYLTGYELSFSIFYLLPVSYLSWSIGKRAGILISIFSAAMWFGADQLAGHTYSHPLLPFWNATVRLGYFVISAFLISRLGIELERAQESAATDSLTGIANSRYFHAVLNLELARSKRYRHSLTLAYIDLDNFKEVNDQLGHNAGDSLLSAVAQGINGHIRSTDTVARLGGDEFAILFPETSFEAAQASLQKLQRHLLEAMQRNQWSVTFSIGAVTFAQSPDSADEAIRASDNAMYRAKNRGKNQVIVEQFPKQPTAPA